MPPLACPNCHTTYPDEDVNVQKAIAYCDQCGQLTNLGDLIEEDAHQQSHPEVEFENPPEGCSVIDGIDGTRIVVSVRSKSTAMAGFFISLFVNGGVSMFVFVAIARTVNLIYGSVPSWFPAPKMNGKQMGLGMVIFLWLFLIPFIAIGLRIIFATLTAAFGRCEVVIKGADAYEFTGFGRIGLKRRFDATAVRSIEIKQEFSHKGRKRTCILLKTDKDVRFAHWMASDKREWLLVALRTLLTPQR